jgi:hypothetical protein
MRPGIGPFSFSIMAISLCYGVDIRLKNSMVEKISLFLTLVDLHEFLGDCLIAFQLTHPARRPIVNPLIAHQSNFQATYIT